MGAHRNLPLRYDLSPLFPPFHLIHVRYVPETLEQDGTGTAGRRG